MKVGNRMHLITSVRLVDIKAVLLVLAKHTIRCDEPANKIIYLHMNG